MSRSENLSSATGRPDRTHEHFQGSAFAGPILAQETANRSKRNTHIETAYRLNQSELFRQFASLNSGWKYGRHRHSPPHCTSFLRLGRHVL
jgi:hypothetical protein